MWFNYLVLVLGITYAAEVLKHPLCEEKDGYHSVEGFCDSYIECVNFTASEMICPDGLHYNPRVRWPSYPCGYPTDVSCEGRGDPQPAQPTDECPHQYGFFQPLSSDVYNCGNYRMCVAGQAIEMQCPEGLAFNPETARCDWADLVSTCDVEQYIGFICPPAPLDEEGIPLEIVYYAYEGSCTNFFSCENGRPRLLTCDPGTSFDVTSGRCLNEQEVKCEVKLN